MLCACYQYASFLGHTGSAQLENFFNILVTNTDPRKREKRTKTKTEGGVQ